MRFIKTLFFIVTLLSLSRVESVSLKKLKSAFSRAKSYIFRKKPTLTYKPFTQHVDAVDLQAYFAANKIPYEKNVDLVNEIKQSLLTCLSYIPPQTGFGINIDEATQLSGLNFANEIFTFETSYPSHFTALSDMMSSQEIKEDLEGESSKQIRKSDNTVGSAFFINSIQSAISSEACVKMLTRRSKFFQNLFHSKAKAMRIVHWILQSSISIARNKLDKGFASASVMNAFWKMGLLNEKAHKKLLSPKILGGLQEQLQNDILARFLYFPANVQALGRFLNDGQQFSLNFESSAVSKLMATIYNIPMHSYNAITAIKYPEIGVALQIAFQETFQLLVSSKAQFVQLSVPCAPFFAKGADYYAIIKKVNQEPFINMNGSTDTWNVLQNIGPEFCFTKSEYNSCVGKSRFSWFKKSKKEICEVIQNHKDHIVLVNGKVVKEFMKEVETCDTEECVRGKVPKTIYTSNKTFPQEMTELVSALLEQAFDA